MAKTPSTSLAAAALAPALTSPIADAVAAPPVSPVPVQAGAFGAPVSGIPATLAEPLVAAAIGVDPAVATAATARPIQQAGAYPMQEVVRASAPGGGLVTAAGAPPRGPHLMIICSKPGFRRAGVSHPGCAYYALDAFTQLQLDLIRSEPKLHLVAVGGEPIPRPGPGLGAPARVAGYSEYAAPHALGRPTGTV